ncbi:hypothetical protein J2T57_001532 [Natronocella acetinitrilica]|uniref:Uncharacterized protein n=1 Tax=Natronocella acetinitrilica TaxID=414046 RepID=A0AAE3G2B5_9GAMM|nr:hypothetical protein [Natronocella acetinitrilica]MCP1674430.1 hypothetical protein [Natronocella acetinitrilica]
MTVTVQQLLENAAFADGICYYTAEHLPALRAHALVFPAEWTEAARGVLAHFRGLRVECGLCGESVRERVLAEEGLACFLIPASQPAPGGDHQARPREAFNALADCIEACERGVTNARKSA